MEDAIQRRNLLFVVLFESKEVRDEMVFVSRHGGLETLYTS